MKIQITMFIGTQVCANDESANLVESDSSYLVSVVLVMTVIPANKTVKSFTPTAGRDKACVMVLHPATAGSKSLCKRNSVFAPALKRDKLGGIYLREQRLVMKHSEKATQLLPTRDSFASTGENSTSLFTGKCA